MALPIYMTAVAGLTHEIDALLSTYVYETYQHLADYLRFPVSLLLILYVVITGWMMSLGLLKQTLAQLMRTVLVMALIVSVGLHWSLFSQFVYHLLLQAAGQVGDVIMHAAPITLPHIQGEGIDGGLQSLLIEFTKVGVWAWLAGGWHNVGPLVNALLIWGFGYSLLFVGLYECVLAKIMLSVLLASAPFFMSLAVFRKTQTFFDRWLGACVGFSFLLILMSSVLALILHLAEWSVAGMYQSKASHLKLVGFVPVMMIGVIGIGVILKTAQLAHSIGGTVTGFSAEAVWAGAMAAFVMNRLHIPKINNKRGYYAEKPVSSTSESQQSWVAVRVQLRQAERSPPASKHG